MFVPGGGNYDLLDHEPSPTAITDALPPMSTDTPAMDLSPMDSADLTPPDLRADGAPPTSAVSLDLSGGDGAPQPSMQVLPEPSAGIVALIAGGIGLSRQRRRKSI